MKYFTIDIGDLLVCNSDLIVDDEDLRYHSQVDFIIENEDDYFYYGFVDLFVGRLLKFPKSRISKDSIFERG